MSIAFRLLGIPIRIHLWFWLMALWLWSISPEQSWAGLLVWVAVVFQGIVMHEMGHALAGRAFGRSPRIELVALGGLTWWEQREPMSPGRSLVVSAAGPAVGILVGLLSLLAMDLLKIPDPSLARYAFRSLVWVNLGWGLLNLAPIMPLDGGNIVASLFEFVAPSRGRLFATYVSFAVIGLLLPVTIAYKLYFGTIILVLLGFSTYQVFRAERSKPLLGPKGLVGQAFAALERGDGQSLVSVASDLVNQAGSAADLDEAFHLLGWGRLLSGEADEAYSAIRSMSGERTADPALEGAVLTELGRPNEAIPLLEEACERGGTFAEGYYVRAVRDLGAFAQAAQFLSRPGAPTLSEKAVQALHHFALTAEAFDAANKLAGLPALRPAADESP
ncbi:MAG: site-2 protease family protein [Myxococcota bacterium]